MRVRRRKVNMENKIKELKKRLVADEITLEEYNNSLREYEDAETAERNRQEEAAEETESSETEEENEAAQEESEPCCEEEASEEKQPAHKEHRREAGCGCPEKPYGLYALIGVLALLLAVSVFTGGFGLRATGGAIADDAGAFPGIEAEEIADPSLGPADAKVTIVEYSDFECPFCQRAQETVKKALEEYGGQVKLVFKNYPLSNIHKNAIIAAEAGECANEQGNFWEMHDKMFANRLSLEKKDLKNYAKEIGLNQEQFNRCLDSGKYKSAIDKDVIEGNKLGFNGVPAFFINKRLLSGAQPIEEFRKVIDEELAK